MLPNKPQDIVKKDFFRKGSFIREKSMEIEFFLKLIEQNISSIWASSEKALNSLFIASKADSSREESIQSKIEYTKKIFTNILVIALDSIPGIGKIAEAGARFLFTNESLKEFVVAALDFVNKPESSSEDNLTYKFNWKSLSSYIVNEIFINCQTAGSIKGAVSGISTGNTAFTKIQYDSLEHYKEIITGLEDLSYKSFIIANQVRSEQYNFDIIPFALAKYLETAKFKDHNGLKVREVILKTLKYEKDKTVEFPTGNKFHSFLSKNPSIKDIIKSSSWIRNVTAYSECVVHMHDNAFTEQKSVIGDQNSANINQKTNDILDFKALIWAYGSDFNETLNNEIGRNFKREVKKDTSIIGPEWEEGNILYKGLWGRRGFIKILRTILTFSLADKVYPTTYRQDQRLQRIRSYYVIYTLLNLHLGTPWPATIMANEENIKAVKFALYDAMFTAVCLYGFQKSYFDFNKNFDYEYCKNAIDDISGQSLIIDFFNLSSHFLVEVEKTSRENPALSVQDIKAKAFAKTSLSAEKLNNIWGKIGIPNLDVFLHTYPYFSTDSQINAKAALLNKIKNIVDSFKFKINGKDEDINQIINLCSNNDSFKFKYNKESYTQDSIAKILDPQSADELIKNNTVRVAAKFSRIHNTESGNELIKAFVDQTSMMEFFNRNQLDAKEVISYQHKTIRKIIKYLNDIS